MAEPKATGGGEAADSPASPATPGKAPTVVMRRSGSVSIPPLVTWTLVTVGAWLIYTSIKGLSPIGEIKAALTGKASPGATPLAPYTIPEDLVALGATQSGESATYTSRAASQGSAAEPTNLVDVGPNSYGGQTKLVPGAAAGFQAWQTAFGAPITCTSGWRSYASQAAEHAKDPGRFASADTSWHVKGKAVDVDLQAIGAVPPAGNTPGNATWTRLYTTALATGWCNPRGPSSKKKDEPWHFSFGGCG